jgi:hypothetical protein
VNKKSFKGCWVPGEQLDLSSLILDLFCRRHTQKEQRLLRVRAKERAEREIMEKERNSRIAEAAQKAKEEKLRKEEARKLARLKKQEDATKKKLEQEAKKKARMLAKIQSQKQQLKDQSMAHTVEIERWEKQKEFVFSSHEMQVEYALRSWTDRGYTSVPESDIIKLRKMTVEKLMTIMDRLRQFNEPVMSSQQMLSRMFRHEKQAASKVQINKDGVGTTSKSSNDTNGVSPAGTGIYGNTSRTPQSTTSSKYTHGDYQKLFSWKNNPNIPSMSASRNDEQNRRRRLHANGNSAQINISNQQGVEDNILPPQPTMNPMQQSPNEPSFASRGSSNYFDSKNQGLGLQSNSGQGGFVDRSFNIQPQKYVGDFQNQVQVQHSTGQFYSTPDTKKDPFVGSSGGTDAFKSIQQYPSSNQQVNSISQPFTTSSSLTPMKSAQQLVIQPPTTSILQQQQQQQKRNYNEFSRDQGLQTHHNHRFAQPTNQNKMEMNHQVEMNHQNFNNPSNSNYSASNGSGSSVWNRQSFGTKQQNILMGQKHEPSSSGQAGIQQKQQFNRNQYSPFGTNQSTTQTDVMRGSSRLSGKFGNPNSNQMNAASQPVSISRQQFNMGCERPQSHDVMNQQGINLFSGQQQALRNTNSPYNVNEPNRMNVSGQKRHRAMAMVSQNQQDLQQVSFQERQQYSQLQSGQQQYSQSQSSQQQYSQSQHGQQQYSQSQHGQQRYSQLQSGQQRYSQLQSGQQQYSQSHQQQQQRDQMESQPGQQRYSQLQSGQQQYSQSHQQQQQQRDQMESIQKQIHMLQQQQKQQNMQRGQFNAGSNSNNFY